MERVIEKHKIVQFVGLLLLMEGFFMPTMIPKSYLNAVCMATNIYLLYLFGTCVGRELGYMRKVHYVLFPVLLSFITALSFHGQSIFLTSLVAYKWLGILICVFLWKYKFSSKEVYWGLTIFSFLWFVCYIISVVVYPSVLFANPYATSADFLDSYRGWYRIFIGGTFLLYFLLYWNVGKYSVTQKNVYLFLIFFYFIAIVTTLSRQHIILNFVMLMLIFLKDLSWRRKIFISIIVGVVMVYYVPKTEIYQNFVEITEMQYDRTNGGETDVRVEAYDYYLKYNKNNIGQSLFGNGFFHSESAYGKEIMNIQRNKQYILADVGGAYFYFHFGLIGCLFFVGLFIKLLTYKTSKDTKFIKYYLLSCLLGTIFSNQLNNSMECLSIVIFLLYLDERKKVLVL